MGFMRLPNRQGFVHFCWHVTWENFIKIDKMFGTSRKNICICFFSASNAAFNCSQEWGGEGVGRLKIKHGEPWKGVWGFQGSQEWGRKGLAAVQCAPHQLLVVEVCWEAWDGLPRWELAGTEEGSKWSMGRGLVCHPLSSGNWNGDYMRLGCVS